MDIDFLVPDTRALVVPEEIGVCCTEPGFLASLCLKDVRYNGKVCLIMRKDTDRIVVTCTPTGKPFRVKSSSLTTFVNPNGEQAWYKMLMCKGFPYTYEAAVVSSNRVKDALRLQGWSNVELLPIFPRDGAEERRCHTNVQICKTPGETPTFGYSVIPSLIAIEACHFFTRGEKLSCRFIP